MLNLRVPTKMLSYLDQLKQLSLQIYSLGFLVNVYCYCIIIIFCHIHGLRVVKLK